MACGRQPDPHRRQERLVVALARFGGLRCPSEVALLRWSDILWDEKRFVVTSPKTARYGKGSRTVPIFPRLQPFLDEAFEMAREGDKWVIPMLDGNTSKNIGTRFKKIIRRAGVEGWPKPFQNLRASLQTELEDAPQLATHVVCSWLENSPRVAQNHYLTVTEEHFQFAVSDDLLTGDKLGMQTPAGGRTAAHEKSRVVINARETSSFSDIVDVLENTLVAEEGHPWAGSGPWILGPKQRAARKRWKKRYWGRKPARLWSSEWSCWIGSGPSWTTRSEAS